MQVEGATRKPLFTAAVLLADSQLQLLEWWRAVVGPTLAVEHAHHMTIEFKPATVVGFDEGGFVELHVVGFSQDERGQAVLVEGVTSTNARPHVTVATATGTKPFYSNELLARGVTPIDGPILKAVLGIARS